MALPYLVKDLKKVETPCKVESPTTRRRLLDRTFSSEAIVDSLPPLQRSPSSSPRSSPRSSILLNAEKSGFSPSVHVLLVLGVLIGTLIVASVMTNDALTRKVSDLERLREELSITQATINAQLQRNQRRYEAELLHANDINPDATKLMSEMKHLEEILAQERKNAIQIKQDLDLLTERARQVESASLEQEQVLTTALQKMARKQVIAQFGLGPHYAQFTLNITGVGIREFLVEFASVDYMPVTVNNFLQQIQQGLWDDSSFYLKAAHVVVARPLSWDMKRSKREAFGDLLQLPFSEYSDNVPHTKYTLGLNGHPSGPDFYVNFVDNTIPHGPRGHQMNGSADPCFATVIIGRDTVDLLAGLRNKHDDQLVLEYAVQIVQVKIVEELDEVPGGREYLTNKLS